jgi:hypothetical protein
VFTFFTGAHLPLEDSCEAYPIHQQKSALSLTSLSLSLTSLSLSYPPSTDLFLFRSRGRVNVKGKGDLNLFWLDGCKEEQTAESSPEHIYCTNTRQCVLVSIFPSSFHQSFSLS